jgi:Spherulation-specific family 4
MTTPSLLVVYYNAPPDANWDRIVAAKAAHPGTDMTVILDPTVSGAGLSLNQGFLDVANRLHAVGARAIGYVWTRYGSRVGPGAQLDISNYALWYGVDGVFLDGVRSTPGSEPAYASLAQLARSLKEMVVVGNPGTQLAGAAYGSTFDALITDEGSSYPADVSQSYIEENVMLNATKVAASTGKYLYVTDGTYNSGLPSYFEQLVAMLDTGVAPPPPSNTVLIPPGSTKITFI